jgi:small subunit ribosomal protein S19
MTRSLSKGPYVDPKLAEKLEKVKKTGKREVIKTYKRASTITPDFVGLTIAVHDGRKFVSVYVTENMVGHKLGEFAPTRTFRMHSGQRKTDKIVTGGAPAAAPGAMPGAAASAAATPTPAAAPAARK